METIRQIYKIPLERIEFNEGQIEGLPKNPRFWTREELDNLIGSIKEDPQLLEMRGLIVLEDPARPGRYVTLGGNMRLAALQEMTEAWAPAMIAEGTDMEECRRIVMKDNGHLGSYDTDEVANHWAGYVKPEWGAPVWLSELAQAGEAAGEGGEGGADLNLALNGGAGSLKKGLAEAGGMFQVAFAFPIEFRDDIEGYIGINTKEVLRDKIIEICRGVEAK